MKYKFAHHNKILRIQVMIDNYLISYALPLQQINRFLLHLQGFG